MTLKKVKNNLTINGVEYDVWYNPDDGVLMLRAKTEFEILQKKLNKKLIKIYKV